MRLKKFIVIDKKNCYTHICFSQFIYYQFVNDHVSYAVWVGWANLAKWCNCMP